MSKRICVIVPAYNEAENIASVIAELKSYRSDIDIVVINDGSTDRTAQVAESTGQAVVLNLPCNLGIGGGVQTGFRYAARNKHDFAIQFDGDGQHIASEIDRLMTPLLADAADVVIGSRFIGEQRSAFQSTLMRRLGIRIFALLNTLIIGQKITDNTSGFRAYSRRAICLLAHAYPVDYPEPEAVILLGKNGFRIHEVPAQMRARTRGQSSISGLKSAHYMFKVITSILVASMRPPIKGFGNDA